MLINRKKNGSSFGSDGRRLTTTGGVTCRTICSTHTTKQQQQQQQQQSSSSTSSSSSLWTMTKKNHLFQSGTKLLLHKAPLLPGILRTFQRPSIKRRAYEQRADQALQQSSLGPRKRMDGMQKLMARAGRGLTFQLPKSHPSGETSDESDLDDDNDNAKQDEQPYTPLRLWHSPHEGGTLQGLPPKLVKERQADEYGVEEELTVVRPAPIQAYSKESVFVPPILGKWLREHQREGVLFCYQCVMGLREFKGQGCILADDMGLGKTLQSVCLIYTLLKTSITSNREPTAKRVIVVCPCSLVKNWDNEFVKWLGPGAVKTMALAESDKKTVAKNLDIFVKTRMFNILIVSYETIRTHISRLVKHNDCCDLLVCDEAHRLKNSDNQTSKALASIPVQRRVLLTGTPMQNDLQEFFAMVDFTNPGVLGTQEEFRKNMLLPILRGREPDATETQKKKMMQIQNDMSSTVNDFILRRVNTLNAQHLPPKLVQVVCCNLTPMQENVYQHLVNSKDMQHVMSGKQANCLGYIQMLMKLCNHPSLIVEEEATAGKTGNRRAGVKQVKYSEDGDEEKKAMAGVEDISKFLPLHQGGRGMNAPVHPEWSGKMFVLFRLMREMRKPGNGADKIVIVSNYTQTLDLIGRMCRENSWGFCRLDGSISMKKRQKMVDEFNDPTTPLVAFLLSSKAGGCGLNLIGGNRLVLFDPDWNPAVDKQAAARCWRDGQKKRCFTYRFLATGTVEEKIFQRQLSKEGLQSVVDDKEQVNALSTKDLRNLFKLRCGTPSDTHDKLQCERCKIIADHAEMEGNKVLPKKLAACKELLLRMVEQEGGEYFAKPMNPEDHGNTKEEWERIVKQPMDLGTIRTRLDLPLGQSSSYESISAFSKDVNRIFANVMKVWCPGQDVADAARRLQSWWLEEWTNLVPVLMSMKSDVDAPIEDPADGDDAEIFAPTSLDERGDDYQQQIGMPDEENMRSWSHHFTTDTVDDPVFRAAMKGYDAVSFVFGLEVTWSLIQERAQEDEERQALKELEAVQELDDMEGADESDDEGTDRNKADKNKTKIKGKEGNDYQDESENDSHDDEGEGVGDFIVEDDECDDEKSFDDNEEMEKDTNSGNESEDISTSEQVLEESEDETDGDDDGRPISPTTGIPFVGVDSSNELEASHSFDSPGSGMKNRPGMEGETRLRSSRSAQIDRAATSDVLSNKWDCTACTYQNDFRAKKKCKVCGHARPPPQKKLRTRHASGNSDDE